MTYRERLKNRMLTREEKQAQAQRCPCHGIDDYCRCQNMPDRETLRVWRAELIVETICSAM
jgi:hypothetical protein